MGRGKKRGKGRRHDDEAPAGRSARAAARAADASPAGAPARSLATAPEPGTAVRIEVADGERGERVDAVLAARLQFVPPVTRSRVQRAIKAGCVQLNGEVVAKPSLKVAPGDLLLWDDAEFVLASEQQQQQQQQQGD